MVLRISPIILFAVLCGCGSPGAPAPVKPVPKYAGNFVASLGRLEPRDPVTEVGAASTDRLGTLLVQEGQFVKGGDILARLESYHLRQADRDRAAAALADAKAVMEAQDEQAQDRVREAELHVHRLNDVSPREIEAQEARLRELQTDKDLATKELARYRILLDKDAISRQDFERQSAKLDAATSAVEAQRATVARLKAGLDSDTGLAQAELATRKAERETLRRSAQIASLMESLKVADAELEKTVIRAPTAGQIIEILARPGESVEGRPILRMGDVSQMYARAEIYETDIARVHTGQRAEISSQALSRVLRGHVEQVGTSVFKRQVRSLDPQADVDARVVQVRIRLDDSAEAARFVGLQVDVHIDAGQ